MAAYRTRLADTGAPAWHAVHSERLQQGMSELNRLAYDRLPQESDTKAERRRHLRAAAEVAAAIAETARRFWRRPGATAGQACCLACGVEDSSRR